VSIIFPKLQQEYDCTPLRKKSLFSEALNKEVLRLHQDLLTPLSVRNNPRIINTPAMLESNNLIR
jgi:hypothetical protein